MQAEGVLGKQLAFSFAAGVGVPELGAEDETTKGLDTAGVNIRSVLRWTREQRLLELAGMVEFAQAGVELSIGRAGEQSCCASCCESTSHLEN